MIQILDSGDMKLIQDLLNRKGNHYLNELVRNESYFRTGLFTSEIIAIGEIENDSIKSMLCVSVPLGTNNPARSMNALCIPYDAPFMNEAMKEIGDVIELNNYSKIEAFVNMETSGQAIKCLEKIGFVKEARLKNDKVEYEIWSMFFQR